jgi:NAD(P)-dependent dehydrogenase (short-subunit alcohol dehydrogenase family)
MVFFVTQDVVNLNGKCIPKYFRRNEIMAGIEGHAAVVTGAASGIRKSIAQKLSKEGAHVCIVDINGEKAEEVASELNRQGYSASAHQLDVAQSAQVSAFFQEIEGIHGQVHILVNNAGIAGRPFYVTEMDDQTWLRMLSIHANGSFFCLRETAKIMKRHGYGRIVNMSSLGAFCAVPFFLLQSKKMDSQ